MLMLGQTSTEMSISHENTQPSHKVYLAFIHSIVFTEHLSWVRNCALSTNKAPALTVCFSAVRQKIK